MLISQAHPSATELATIPQWNCHPTMTSTPLQEKEAATLRLSVSLLGRCFSFLNLKESQATHSVSHQFHEATRTESAWNENANLPSFHYATFSSPRIRLQSTTRPLIDQLGMIRSSTHSYGHAARWLEVNGKAIKEWREIHPLIKQESKYLDGLMIRQLNLVPAGSILPVNEPDSLTRSLTHLRSSLRFLMIGGVDTIKLNHLLPIIAAIHSLQVLELELYPADVSSQRYDLPPSFSSSISQLKELHSLILSDPLYRRQMNGHRLLRTEQPIILSNASLDQLSCLVKELPQLKLDLCVMVRCATINLFMGNYEPPPSIPLSTVTTLAISLSLHLTSQKSQEFFSFFPSLTSLSDLSDTSDWRLFGVLPPTLVELTVLKLTISPPRDTNHSMQTSRPLAIRRLTIYHLTITELNPYSFHPSPSDVFGSVEEFYSHLPILPILGCSHIDLYSFMPNLRIGTFYFLKRFEQWEEQGNETRSYLVQQLPSATRLHIVQADGNLACAYEARELLRAIPHLKEVKWNNEPWLALDRIESYYSWPSIDQRQNERLNLDRLDQIQPILHQINSSSLPNTPTLSLLSLTLIFQFLTPYDLFSTHRVCRSYRVAAVSPLVLRPNIRVRMDDEKGVVVSGTQVSFTSIKPMLSAVRSMLFQNIRILSLGQPAASTLQPNPRQINFYYCHLKRFEVIPHFHSLHTLSLDWSVGSFLYQAGVSATDQELIERIFRSATLKHLKVLKLSMGIKLMTTMLNQWISHLHELTVIEIRVNKIHGEGVFGRRDSLPLCALSKLTSLKQVFMDHGYETTTPADLDDLLQLNCTSDSIESIIWYPPIPTEVIQKFIQIHWNGQPVTKLQSIKLTTAQANQRLACLDTMIQLTPNITHLNFNIKGSVDCTLPQSQSVSPSPISLTRLSQQLTALQIHCQCEATIRMILTVLSQSVQSGLIWSHLVEFSFVRDFFNQDDFSTRRNTSTSQCLESILQSMPSLRELTLEGLIWPFDRDPHPWMRRLRVFRHSIYAQLKLLLPHAQQLRELFTPSLYCAHARRALPPLDTLPQFQLLKASDRQMNRHQLIQALQEDAKPQQPSNHAPRLFVTRKREQPHQPSTMAPSTMVTTSTFASTHTSSIHESLVADSTSIPPITTSTEPHSNNQPDNHSLSTPTHASLNVDQLAGILMELADSFQLNNSSSPTAAARI